MSWPNWPGFRKARFWLEGFRAFSGFSFFSPGGMSALLVLNRHSSQNGLLTAALYGDRSGYPGLDESFFSSCRSLSMFSVVQRCHGDTFLPRPLPCVHFAFIAVHRCANAFAGAVALIYCRKSHTYLEDVSYNSLGSTSLSSYSAFRRIVPALMGVQVEILSPL